MIAEPDYSTPVIPGPTIGHNLKLLPFTSHPHNVSPSDPY